MKKVVTVTEVEGEGLVSLLDQRIYLLCDNFMYVGNLKGVNETCVLLEDAHIIYETGAWTANKWQLVEKMHIQPAYIQISKIEMFGPTIK